MKKQLLLLAAIFIATSASAQFYISGSGGAQMGSAGILMATELNASKTEASVKYGSFGEGLNMQLRAGYFFNETVGVEASLGYLHGADQSRDSYKATSAGVITEIVDAKAYARAYGFSAALVYNFSKNIYGKFGAVTKVGGRTGAELTRSTTTPFGPVVAAGEQDYHGRIPLGFIGGLGYKYKISENLNLFAELEYLGINVTRDNSEFTKLTITTPVIPANALGAGHPGLPSSTWNLGDAPLVHPVFGTLYAPTKITYVDNLSTTNTDPSKALSEVSPYSSFGINFGITYTFGSK